MVSISLVHSSCTLGRIQLSIGIMVVVCLDNVVFYIINAFYAARLHITY